MKRRAVAHQVMNLLLILLSAAMIWKGLCVASGSESPVVVVLSESMYPAYTRGDIVFLWMGEERMRIGEIVVFKVRGRPVPIVHRILERHARSPKHAQTMLTKGDNNRVHDRGLYNGLKWLRREDIVGRSRFCEYA
jgi:signal peptidase